MPLSWNEIRSRALEFSKRWEHESSEDAEAKAFWTEFLNVFGIDRKRVASFEEPVKKLGDKQGFIDLFWKGVMLVEHKSRGKDLDKAYVQALDYFPGIKERDLPKYVLVSDFARFRLYDLEDGTQHEFECRDLHKNIKAFGFIAGYQTRPIQAEDPVNIKAAELMGKLHDALKEIGYDGHALEHYLVRLLFCLFAEDTGIFELQQFQEYIRDKTAEDGSDLAPHLAQLFEVLNTAPNKRLKNLDEQLADFAYVNGKLFAEHLPTASFDAKMRNQLLDCCALNWSRVSPAIFGSLFQSVMDDKLRRNLGAHYTSEANILKLIKPLFLDELRAEFERYKNNSNKLAEFHQKLRKLKFFDPACGCGNFLIIAYRELRLLELDILRELQKKQKNRLLDATAIVLLDVDQFYGIEIEEFPAQIAQVAMWLTDHQMNQLISEEFGNYFARLPLKKSASIACGNALQLDWRAVAPDADYLLGNPPFIGSKMLGDAQRKDMESIFHGVKGAGVLDYVAAWYLKAAQYMTETSPHQEITTASTPSPRLRGEGWGEGHLHHRDAELEEKLKGYARELRASATDAEQKIWYLLRNRNFLGYKFRRQHPVGNYILDFYCPDAKLAIELDGSQHAENEEYDCQRSEILQADGIQVLRFWNNDVLRNTEAVLMQLANALPLTPALSPQAGGGSKSKAACAFVSTNSITQGEQVGILWGELLHKYQCKIHFAHRTFKWGNDARGKAAVHCVIIGFAPFDVSEKRLWDYEKLDSDAHEITVSNINPYLLDAPNVIAEGRMQPLSAPRSLVNGSIPADGGHLILEPHEKDALLVAEPMATNWLRPYLGAEGFIHNQYRYCLWLLDCAPNVLRQMPLVMRRVEAVRTTRLASSKIATQEKAAIASCFTENRQPKQGSYLALPRTSSENRRYIPIGFLSAEVIAANDLQIIPDAEQYEFGIVSSLMHMAWMKITSGRLKSDYRYSAKLTYNTFPWPSDASEKQRNAIETAAQAVLDARAQFMLPSPSGRGAGGEGSSLADLYDPLTMPPALVKAHQQLDRAVDASYRKAPFANDAQRVEFLFERYQQLTSLLPVEKKITRRKK
ncbi:MAG: DUF559 domain-containing protein [Sideroxydans sp.]|nr:DUF559 domain-containing protein [Sideroxydans sp.]